MSLPSIKGTAFQSAAEDLNRFVEEGRIGRDALEARLQAADLVALDEKVSPARWYPIATYARVVELLVELEAEGCRHEYLCGRGARAAERLAALGIYDQLNASAETWGERVGNIIASIQGALFNFTRWTFCSRGAGKGFEVVVEDAADFPEASRFAAQGFIQYLADHTANYPLRVTSARPARDRIVYIGEPI